MPLFKSSITEKEQIGKLPNHRKLWVELSDWMFAIWYHPADLPCRCNKQLKEYISLTIATLTNIGLNKKNNSLISNVACLRTQFTENYIPVQLQLITKEFWYDSGGINGGNSKLIFKAFTTFCISTKRLFFSVEGETRCSRIICKNRFNARGKSGNTFLQ